MRATTQQAVFDEAGRGRLQKDYGVGIGVLTRLSTATPPIEFTADGFRIGRYDPEEGTIWSEFRFNGLPQDHVSEFHGRFPPIICGPRTNHVWLVDEPIEAFRLLSLFDVLEWSRPTIIVTRYADFETFPRVNIVRTMLSSAKAVYIAASKGLGPVTPKPTEDKVAQRDLISAFVGSHCRVSLVFPGRHVDVTAMLESAAERQGTRAALMCPAGHGVAKTPPSIQVTRQERLRHRP